MEKEIKRISENFSDYSESAIVGLIERLTEIAEKHNEAAVISAFDKFENHNTLNYVCDAKLAEFPLKKWTKSQIVNWLEENELESHKDGVFNFGALAVAMNYEADTHKNVVDEADEPPLMAYKLAIGALQKAGYVDSILRHY